VLKEAWLSQNVQSWGAYVLKEKIEGGKNSYKEMEYGTIGYDAKETTTNCEGLK